MEKRAIVRKKDTVAVRTMRVLTLQVGRLRAFKVSDIMQMLGLWAHGIGYDVVPKPNMCLVGFRRGK